MIPVDWIDHRRADGEVVGYLVFEGDAWTPHSLLGVPVGKPGELADAETRLDELGLAALIEPWEFVDGSGAARRVVIREINRSFVTIQSAEFALVAGASTASREVMKLDLPTERLRPRRGGTGDQDESGGHGQQHS